MKIIRRGRGQGKTIELIKISSEKGIPIVCSNKMKAQIVADTARQMGLDIPRPISMDSFIYNCKEGRRTEDMRFQGCLIDDLKEVLDKVIPFTINYATTSCEVLEDRVWEKETTMNNKWF